MSISSGASRSGLSGGLALTTADGARSGKVTLRTGTATSGNAGSLTISSGSSASGTGGSIALYVGKT